MSGANGNMMRLNSTPTRSSPGKTPTRRSAGKTSPKRSMATMKRLSDSEVRSIFECLHHGKPPPPNLKFQIVPVGPAGLKLSPPAYEFEDGLYVLLRPQKKLKNSSQVDQPKVPAHLKHLIMKQTPPGTCPWRLSGPQFPQPTAIQQRYCYPNGRSEYSGHKGASLWTMYGANGKEDKEYRLLHVYFSVKRAVNKGISVPDQDVSSAESASLPLSMQGSPPPKRLKRYPHFQSPPRMTIQGGHNPRSPFNPCASITTASSAKSPSICNSPLSFDGFPPPSPGANFNHFPHFENSNFVSPNNDPFRRCHYHPASPEANLPTPSPFRRPPPVAHHNIQQSPLQRNLLKDDTSDLFPLEDMGATWHEIDSYWNDPLLSIMLKPSQDPDVDSIHQDNPETTSPSKSPNSSLVQPRSSNAATTISNFTMRLETLHETIRERILAAPESEQAALVKLLTSWAAEVAKDPLSGLTLSASKSTKDDDNDDSKEQPAEGSPPQKSAQV